MTNSADLVDASLAAIAEHGARTNAFILVDADGARAAARAADDERRRGIDRGPLHGMPISIKDLIDIAGQPTTAASRVRAGHVAERDATVIQRLREAGAVIIGKTNLHEFAFGTTSEETAYGAVHNPHDASRSAGGSSGGSAAAVALGMGLASIGSDTGGSIRIPAAACGVVGLKPSLGEVPTDGVVQLSATFDHVGPITRSVADAAALWAVLAGRAIPRIESPAPSAITLGALGGYFTALLDGEVRAAFDAGIARLRAAGMRDRAAQWSRTPRASSTRTSTSRCPRPRTGMRPRSTRARATTPAGARASRARSHDLGGELSPSARRARVAAARRRCRARRMQRAGASDAADRRAGARRRRGDDGQRRVAHRARGDAAADAALQHHRASGDLAADSHRRIAGWTAARRPAGSHRRTARRRDRV